MAEISVFLCPKRYQIRKTNPFGVHCIFYLCTCSVDCLNYLFFINNKCAVITPDSVWSTHIGKWLLLKLMLNLKTQLWCANGMNITAVIYFRKIYILGHVADAFVQSDLLYFLHTSIRWWWWLRCKVPTRGIEPTNFR